MFRTAIIYLNCIKWFVTGTQCVYCEVGTELYCISFFSLLLLVLARGFVEESFCRQQQYCFRHAHVPPSASAYGTLHYRLYKILPLDSNRERVSYLSRMKTVGVN